MSAKETREVSVSLLLNEALNRNPNSRDTNLQDLCLSSSSCKVRTAARLCLNMHLGRTSFHMRAGSYRVLANRARLWVSGSVLVSGFRVWHLTFSIHGLGLTRLGRMDGMARGRRACAGICGLLLDWVFRHGTRGVGVQAVMVVVLLAVVLED